MVRDIGIDLGTVEYFSVLKKIVEFILNEPSLVALDEA